MDLTGAVAAAVVALEPEQWTDAIGCTVDEYEACLVEWRPDMPLELVRSIKFRLHGALLEGVIALGRAIRANVEGRPRMSEVPKELQPLIATFEGLDFVDMVPPAMVERFVKALCDPYRREPQQSIQEAWRGRSARGGFRVIHPSVRGPSKTRRGDAPSRCSTSTSPGGPRGCHELEA